MSEPSTDDQPDVFPTRIMRCWGKSGTTPHQFHPVLYHMLDAGHVAQQLLKKSSPRWRRALGCVLGVDLSTDGLSNWISWLVALHDIGKISAAFQGSSEEQRQRMLQEGFSFKGWPSDPNILHTHIGQAFVENVQPFLVHNLDPQTKRVCANVIGGHHGRYLIPDDVSRTNTRLACYEPSEWAKMRLQAAELLYELLVGDGTEQPIDPPYHCTGATLLLTGFAILCDWLASDTRHFPLCADMPSEEYVIQSQHYAEKAVQAAGFSQHTLSTTPPRFTTLFPSWTSPRPVQAAIDQVPQEVLAAPCLAIIEAPTGEGKTEAALALAHRIAHSAQDTDEMYYALPTTATSNQMFQRVQHYLNEHLNLPSHVKLVHGQAYLVEDDLRVELPDEGDPEEKRALLEWFAPLKRSLLAPFGVGTVDQAELAALNVKHGTLRLLGLAGKVVIFDEVHAYDTYMTCVVERLLSWLSVLGSSVILLSATLPRRQRNRLVCAYGCDCNQLETLGNAYPLLYVGNRNSRYAIPTGASQPERHIILKHLHLRDGDEQEKAHQLLQLVKDGGCVCWITNTVARAQQIFRALESFAPREVQRSLLHAQYPLEERQQREQELVQRYGKGGERPKQGIVVGTQVLEQSLDLDFDVMISDLAPVDLILQRAGRLHRHARARPAAHSQPVLYVNAPLNDSGKLDIAVDACIYAAYHLRYTWRLLCARHAIILPRDYRALIEALYGANAPPGDDTRLARDWKELEKKQQMASQEANLRLLPTPQDPEALLCAQIARAWLFEEDESGSAWITAHTRLTEESVTVIPLELNAADLASATHARATADEGWLPLDRPPTRDVQLRLLRRSLRVSRADAVGALKSLRSNLPPLLKEAPLLRSCIPLWLHQGCAYVQKVIFSLDPTLGLVIERET